MTKYQISVLVPTRNRGAYLRSCLHSIVDAAFDGVEIVVSDNSDPERLADTRVALADFAGRIRYVRPPEPLGMSAHWSWALRQVNGDFVTIVGDDDAILPGTLRLALDVARKQSADVVQWPYIFYTWPHSRPGGAHAFLSMGRIPSLGEPFQFVVKAGSEILHDSSIWRRPHNVLPMLYNSLVSSAFVSECGFELDGGLPSMSPDVYSGIYIASRARRIVVSQTPLAIAGRSPLSNGAAHLFGESTSAEAAKEDFGSLNRRSGIAPHLRIPTLPSMTLAVADSLEFVRDKLNEQRDFASSLPPYDSVFISNALDDIKDNTILSLGEKLAALDILSASFGSSGVIDAAKQVLRHHGGDSGRSIQSVIPLRAGINFRNRSLDLSGELVTLGDVYLASRLVEALMATRHAVAEMSCTHPAPWENCGGSRSFLSRVKSRLRRALCGS